MPQSFPTSIGAMLVDCRPRMANRSNFVVLPDGVEWRRGHEVVVVRGWGADGVRVQAALLAVHQGLPGALLEDTPRADPQIALTGAGATVTNGNTTARIGMDGQIGFFDDAAGTALLEEQPAHFWWPGARFFSATGNGYHHIEQRFAPSAGERFYGLGQHTHGLFDQKGSVIDLLQRNGEVTIPFLLSSRGYGFLWNSPAIGRVELGNTATRWVADSARQIDYWVTAGSPAEVLCRYADATGKAPGFPDWASGFWQSKLRYRTQDELMTVGTPSTCTGASRSRSSSATSSMPLTSATTAWIPPNGPTLTLWSTN